MKTKIDIQLELLQELDEICLKNNLKYILVGRNALKAYLDHTIKDGARMVGVAMTQGDIDRFCEIIEKHHSSNRYVEGMFNNPKFMPSYVSYGNKNTSYFNMVHLDSNIHHGIHIRLYPIRRSAELDGTPIEGWTPRLKKERKFRKFISKQIESNKFWYIKYGLKALNIAYSLTGGGKRYYKEIKRNIFIDKWDDIQNYSLVRLVSSEINPKCLKELDRFVIDGIELYLPKDSDAYFTEVYTENFRDKVIKPQSVHKNVIVDTEMGYEELINKTSHLIKEARITYEEIAWERRKCDDEKTTVENVWHLVKMTNQELEYKQYFEDKIDDLLILDLDNPEQYEKVYEELKRPISSLRRYARKGMTFSIDPKTDALIEKVMLKRDEGELVVNIKRISKKQYFVE